MDELEAIRARKMQEFMRRARAPAEPVEVSDANFNDFIGQGGLIVVDCWAEWCGPCRMLSPIVDQLAKEYAGRVQFGKLNVDENPATAERFGIMSIPALLIIKDTQLTETVIGAVPKNHIETVLSKYL
jgi:thioredoxin 1